MNFFVHSLSCFVGLVGVFLQPFLCFIDWVSSYILLVYRGKPSFFFPPFFVNNICSVFTNKKKGTFHGQVIGGKLM